jgi:hypothetical protein
MSDSQAPGVRASDAERQAVVDRLNTAVGEGRIDLQEFSERLDLALSAGTREELSPLLDDLPSAPAAPTESAPPAGAPAPGRSRLHWFVSPVGGSRRRGPWRVPARNLHISLLGGLHWDLTEAELSAPVVTLHQFSVIGGTRITVPPGVRVEALGFGILGGRSVEVDERGLGPNAPVLRVVSFSVVGGIQIRGSRRLSASYESALLAREEHREARRALRADLRQTRRELQRERHRDRRERHRDRRGRGF